MSYKNPIPVAVAILFNSDHSKVLVGERKIEPFIGGDALMGGYLEEGETPEKAVKREVGEETERSIDDCVLTYEGSEPAHNNRLLMFFSATAPDVLFDQVADTNEMGNIRFASLEEIQAKPLCFPLHQKMLLSTWGKYRPDLFPESAPAPSWMDTFKYT